MPRNNSRARQDKRQGVAEANVAIRASRTDVQQVDMLDKRLGVSVGATKERGVLTDLTRRNNEDKATAKTTGRRTARRSK